MVFAWKDLWEYARVCVCFCVCACSFEIPIVKNKVTAIPFQLDLAQNDIILGHRAILALTEKKNEKHTIKKRVKLA